jgi:hypothetical protein
VLTESLSPRSKTDEPPSRGAAPRRRADDVAGAVRLVPLAQIRASYARLRRGGACRPSEPGPEFPLLVTLRGDGDYELLDGFKRIDRWRERGHRLVPVLVEPPRSIVEQKRRLLAANAPARTTTTLDESLVVCSLREDDKLGPSAIARLLGRKPAWVDGRLALGRRLSPHAKEALGRAELGPTVGLELCPLAHDEQDRLLGAITQHGLGARDALALVRVWRAADERDRSELLRDPLGVLRPPAADTETRSVRARDLEAEIERLRTALQDLALFKLPPELAPPERRRLEALWRGLVAELRATARHLSPEGAGCEPPLSSTEEPSRDERREPQRSEEQPRTASGEETLEQAPSPPPALLRARGGAPRRARATSSPLWDPRDRPTARPVAQGGDAALTRGGAIDDAVGKSQTKQARVVPRGHCGSGGQEAHDDAHPARDPGARLHGRAHDRGAPCEHAPVGAAASACASRQAAFRDRAG